VCIVNHLYLFRTQRFLTAAVLGCVDYSVTVYLLLALLSTGKTALTPKSQESLYVCTRGEGDSCMCLCSSSIMLPFRAGPLRTRPLRTRLLRTIPLRTGSLETESLGTGPLRKAPPRMISDYLEYDYFGCDSLELGYQAYDQSVSMIELGD
jgi:hypothetical protein